MNASMHPRALLERFGYGRRNGSGQNFLTDAGAAARIARLLADGHIAARARVLEIGPGTGHSRKRCSRRMPTSPPSTSTPTCCAFCAPRPDLQRATSSKPTRWLRLRRVCAARAVAHRRKSAVQHRYAADHAAHRDERRSRIDGRHDAKGRCGPACSRGRERARTAA